MTTILGIDAAWTPTSPSCVALLHGDALERSCIAVAPSYSPFLALSTGSPTDWTHSASASEPDPEALLGAARVLVGADVDKVTVDSVFATRQIAARQLKPLTAIAMRRYSSMSASDPGVFVSRALGARDCSSTSASS